MPDSSSCYTCGSPIPPDSGGDECPHCLLALFLDPPDRQQTERQFGDYEIRDEIARGGMGIVFRAHQKSLNRPVALKLIAAGEFASPAAVGRFFVEAEAAGSLHHPNIVSVYEAGEADGQHFLSMRLVEGSNLADTLAANEFPGAGKSREQVIAKLVEKIATAIEYAHHHGVLHRDIKPTNILIDQQGEPLVTDFGLAKLTDGDSDHGLTLSRSTFGTPSYMAPEQASGSASEATTATDVYGIGAVLYELLTGRPPFQAATPVETLRLVLDSPPKSPRSINPQLHRDLETICLRCLEKEPSARYQRAGEVADELARFLRGDPVRARPLSRHHLLWRWCRRNPGIASLAFALLVALIAGIAGVTWQWQRAEASRDNLAETVRHLEWGQVRYLIDRDDAPRAVAELARVIRKDPNNWKAAMYAMSIIDQRRFPLPIGKPIHAPDEGKLLDLSWDRYGQRLAAHTGGNTAWTWNLSTGKTEQTFEYPSSITALTLSPDGSTLYTGNADGQLTTRSIDTDTTTIVELDTPITSLQFGPSNTQLFITHPLEVIRYDPVSESTLTTYPSPKEKISQLAFNGDQSRLAIAAGSQFSVYETESAEPLGSFDAGSKIKRLKFDPSGQRIAVLAGRHIKQWLINDGSLPKLQTDDTQLGYRDLAISPDGNQIVGASGLGNVVLWDSLSGQRYEQNLGHLFRINTVEFSPQSGILLSGASDNTARLWNIPEASSDSELLLHPDEVQWATFLGRDDQVLTEISGFAPTYNYHVWKFSGRVTPTTFAKDFSGQINAVGMSPDGRWVAVASPGRRLGVYHSETSELAFPVMNLLATATIFTASSDDLIIVTANGEIQIRKIPSGELLEGPIQTGLKKTASARLSSDGSLLAIGTHRGNIQIWDTANWDRISACQHESGQLISSLEFSPDKRRLLTTSNDTTARIWDVATGKLITEYTAHTKKVMHATFTPDGRNVVSGSYDFSAHVWNATTGERTLPVLHHRNEVTYVAVSPNGRRIATASRDGIAQVWDTATGTLVNHALHENSSLREVRFSADSSRLITLGFTGIRIWDPETGEPLTALMRHETIDSVGYIGDSSSVFNDRLGSYLVSTNAFATSLHNIEIPSAPVPDWFPVFLESIAMQRIDDGTSKTIPFAKASATRESLITRDSDSPYARWARRLSTTGK